MTDAINIDEELRALIPPLSEDEYLLLEENILRDGCRDPIVLWENTIIDGHNRFKICTEHGVEYQTFSMSFADRDAVMDWMDANQLGRRNLTPDQFRLLLGRRYNRTKNPAGGREGRSFSEDQIDPPKNTASRLAQEHGVSEPTVKRAGRFADEVERTPELREAVSSGVPVRQFKKQSEAFSSPVVEWTDDQKERMAKVDRGETVVASKRDNADRALIQWAIEQGAMVEIGRNTKWGNPFVMDEDGDRDQVCDSFEKHYLPHKPSLLNKIETLKGKVLVCWCYPNRCHGNHLADLANGEANDC